MEISPGSRYDTEGELVGSALRFRSTRRRADLREPSGRSYSFLRHNLGQVQVRFPILRPLLRIPKGGFLHIPPKRYIPDTTRSGLTVRKAFRRGSTLGNGSRSARHHPGLGMTAGKNQPPPMSAGSAVRDLRKMTHPIRFI